MERLQILWIAKSYTLPKAGVKGHCHPYYHMFYISAGEGRFVVDGDVYMLSSGQCLLVPRNAEHAYTNEGDITLEYQEIKFSLAQTAMESRLQSLGVVISREEMVGKLFERIIQEYSDIGGQADDAAASYLMALLNILTAPSRMESKREFRYFDASSYSDLSKQIVHYLEKNYAKELSLDDLAVALGYNKSYLCVAFKKDTHSTILDCLNMIRIRRAAELIVYSDHSLAHVAAMCGFASDSHFNRVFVKYVGTTPGQCRRAYPVNIVFEPKQSAAPTDRPSRFMYSVLAQKRITPQMIRDLNTLENSKASE